MLQRYNAHATFFVSGFSNLDSNQISELLTLQEEGQEIGFHGTHHIDAAPYLLNHSIQEYIDYEITPDLTVMRNSGLNPVGFAYPGGSEDPALSQALHGIFTHVRGINHGSMYYEYGSNPAVIYAQGIDDITYGQSMDDIYNYLAEAKRQDTIVVFYAHVPVETVTGNYMVSHERLENILKYVSDNNMQFYTISELN